MIGPQGQVLPLRVSDLAGSPFDSYFLPGLILFTALGLGPLAVAGLAWRGQRWAPLLTLGVAAELLIWLAVEIWIVGYTSSPPLQAIYIGVGLSLGLIGFALVRRGALR